MSRAAQAPAGAIAIIGMGCRFPGGIDTPDQLWRVLADGVDTVSEYPPERFDLDDLYDPDPLAPGKIYTRHGGFIERIDAFDAGFFGIAPREARRIDPQQRLLLEVTWEALEDGGQVADRLAGSQTGVFVGISAHDYADVQALTHNRHRIDAHLNSGNAASIAANRISYTFDLRGPSLAIDTACSSSLTAVHLACRSLRAGESELAIAGGVGALLAPEVTIGFCKASMLSPDGRCRAFDANANGYVRSEGAGAVVLKPLARALADGDPVHAVILGTAINQDGRTLGMTVPSAAAQEAMIRSALREAGVEPSAVQYVEAHGTGTTVGDPIEAEAVGKVFSLERPASDPCLMGSVKTNLGHLEAASGIAGLIKTALVVKHRQVPANLHLVEPNPDIPFDELRLRVPTTLEPWPSNGARTLAGVNSFGFGGANAHVVIEAPPERPAQPRRPFTARDGEDALHVLTLSARDPNALLDLAARHARRLGDDPAVSLRDYCYSAAARRAHHGERLALVAASRDEFIALLDAFVAGEPHDDAAAGSVASDATGRLAFVFPGMGPQWWAMGRRLFEQEPVFRQRLEEIEELLRPLADWSLLEALAADEESSRVGEAWLAHLANFAIQVSSAALWRSWGIVPDAVVGHSSGEMAAACVAGALSLPDGVRLAYHRGRLQQRATGSGRMLAAAITPEEAQRLIAGREDRVALAAINAPRSVTLTGATDVLEGIERTLAAQQRFVRFLPVEVPYHSPQMDPLREEFLEAIAGLTPTPASIPLVLDVTGDWADGRPLDADYWWLNVRRTVRFGPAVERLLEAGCESFVEVGPHPVLAPAISECGAERSTTVTVLPSLRRGEDDRRVMLRSLGALYTHGHAPDVIGLYPEGSYVPLPTYAWQHERYWYDTGEEEGAQRRPASAGIDTRHPLLGRRLSSPRPSWETRLDDPRTGYLDAHVVQGSTVFPGAASVELMLAAAKDVLGEAPVSVEGIEFQKLLFLQRPRSSVVQVHYHPRDGATEVYSAGGGDTGGDDTWTVHASGRLNPRTPDDTSERMDVRALRDRFVHTVPAEEHYAMFERRAYRFGLEFHTLREIWVGPSEALARVSFPDEVDLSVDPYRVHPALLDGALQLFGTVRVRSEASPRDEAPFFPISIRRLVHRRNPGRQFWAYVKVRHKDDPLLWNGDAWLIDDTGEVCIALEELRLKVLDEDQSPAHAEADDALYALGWEEAALPVPTGSTPIPLPPTAAVRADVETLVEPPDHSPEAAWYLDTAEPTLNRVATGFAVAALDALGWRSGDELPNAPNDDDARGIAPRHRRLLRALLRMRQADDSAPRDAAALHGELDALAGGHPAFGAEIELVRRGGEHLTQILRGDLDAREVLLSGASLALLARLYRSSPTSRDYNTLVAHALSAAIGREEGGRPLRILEVGAGTGAATSAVLPRLPASAEYVFTDVSPFFLAQARELAEAGELAQARDSHGGHPDLRYAVLDIEKDPIEQGFEPATFDLVIAANVVHTTEDVRTSLGHLRQLLAPGGMVMLLELTRRSAWFNLVFGLLDGWWRFADTDLRSESPLLRPAQWRSVLAECGFEQATTLFPGDDEDGRLQTLMLARAPSDERQAAVAARHWLVYADRDGAAVQLAAALRDRGDRTTLVYPGSAYRHREDGGFDLPPTDANAARRLLEETADAAGPLGIVHCWSLNAPPGDAADTAALMDAQAYGCGSVLALVQALEQHRSDRRSDRDERSSDHDSDHLERARDLWLVTAGAQPVDDHDSAPNVAQSALWGLGRVLVSEQAGIRCRIVDLSPMAGGAEIEALAAEVSGDGADEELALRGTTRLVRRLDQVSLADHARRAKVDTRSPETDSFRLEIERPGALDTLRLCEAPTTAPGPGELAVRVVASGLNFRDVLQALGMLPPAAFQDDPDPDGLGIECSGIVLTCGEGTEGFAPGDEVITLTGAAHASRAIVRADLTVPKPAHLTFEDAGSILNAFVTAEYALNHVARIEAGERVLIHSATGAVGLAAIQHCRRIGAEVFATAGTAEKREHLRSLGIEAVMDSRSLAWAEEVLEHTGGEGVDVVLNSLAGEAIGKGLSVLRRYGRFIELGKRDIFEDAQVGLLPFQRNLAFHAVDLIQLSLDRPQLAQRLIRQVVREIADGELSPVPSTSFDLADAEQAFRLMAQAKHIGKIVLSVRGERYPVSTRADASLCQPDGTYLITGGLGGFGLAVAQWLVREEGARTIVLMSRSGTPKDDPAALEALLASPARVIVESGDVAKEQDVRRVLDRIEGELPPLRGVFHAAMVLDDDALVALDEQRFRRVLEPKIAGAWNLDRLTRDLPLDLFVLFSSVAAVVGHPMQGNYSAANAFLDALAAHRRGHGRAAHAIGWGVISDVGYVARHPEIGQHLDRAGLVPLTPGEALTTLGAVLRHDLAHVIAARLRWQKWAQLNSLAAASRRFQRFVGSVEASEPDETDTASPLARLRAAAAEERRSVMETYLLGAIARVLGTTAEKIRPERSLTEIGFDSLMAVELVTGLQNDLGVRLQVVKILEGTSTRGLAQTLLQALDLDTTSPEPTATTAAPHASPRPGDGDDRTPAEPAAAPAASPSQAEASPHPLSFEQRRFWYIEQLEGGNPAYHLFAAARLSGRLDVDALRRCLDELVRRHEALRTRFEAPDGEPVQIVTEPVPAALATHDVSHLGSEEREAALQRIATAEIRRPFDLERPPLLRGALVTLTGAEHAFVLIVHHIAAETWAMTRLVSEIMTLYGAFSRGEPDPLPLPTSRYADYVQRQAELLDEARVRSQRDYWLRRLDGARSALPLLSDHPRPAASGFHGRRHHFVLSRDLSEALRKLARRQEATLFMTLLAAFQALLHRYSGETDISIGTPVFTRDQPGLEEVVGCCMNTVVLRTDLAGDPSFPDLLRRTRETALGAFANQDLPFDKVVETLRPQRGVGRSPLFQAMLVMHDTRFPALRMEGLRVEPLDVDAEAAVADLTLLVETGEQLHGALEYDAALFEEATITQLCGHLVTLLEAIAEQPERPLSALPLHTEGERRRVVVEWNDTAAGYRQGVCLHELVEEQVARQPDALAIVAAGESVTYRELNERANRLARSLQGTGVGPGGVVGVQLVPSPEAVAAALAVVKAGGVYLPLDPDEPEERLRQLITDAQAPVLLTRRAPRDASAIPALVIDLDAERESIARQSPNDPGVASRPDQPAYAIYTSGSTGEPKGVVIAHRAICNQLQWRQHASGLAQEDAVLLHTSLGFDPSVWEIFGPLAAGARLIVPGARDRRDDARLVATMAEHGVSVVQLVPALLEVLLEEPGFARCTNLRHVFCGGEVLTGELRERFFARSRADLHNLYGPTEATIDATHWLCQRDDERPVVPIGRPITNVKAYILDERLQPTPVGVPGELYLGGAGVAQEYLNRPAETARRFLPDPFDGGAGGRLYRSGDRARWRPDGSIEFLGRLDAQLKVRGFRIEPGEIEAALTQHPLVRQAAVTARGTTAGDRRLVAFVTAAREQEPDAASLGAFLRGRLPPFMLPSTFVVLAELPRDAGGKVDRRALASEEPDVSGSLSLPAGAPLPDRAPRDALEERLVRIWEGLFPGRRIGVDDDFFALGGHSLLAMRLAARLRSEFDSDLPVSAVLQEPTIAGLARRLRAPADAGSPLVVVQESGSRRPLFFVHPLGGSTFHYLALARSLGDDRPFYALEANGLDGNGEPHSGIEAMARCYLDALRTVQPDGPYLLGGWSMGGVIAFEMARALEARNDEVALLALLDSGRALPGRGDPTTGEAHDPQILHSFMQSLGMDPERFTVPPQAFARLDDEVQLDYLLAHAKHADLLPGTMDREALRGHLDVFRANLKALRNYAPRPYGGRVTLLEAAESPPAPSGNSVPTWEELAAGGVARTTVPGDHFSMLRPPRVRHTARTLADHLQRAESLIA